MIQVVGTHLAYDPKRDPLKLAQIIHTTKYLYACMPIILMGGFNSTPEDYVFRYLVEPICKFDVPMGVELNLVKYY